LTREVLELGVFISLALEDYKSFEGCINQLKPFYYDFNDILPDSQNKYIILGVFLLYLLVENKIGEFHTELELLQDHSSRYINYVVELEQHKMEGRYNRICKSKSIPDPCYAKLSLKLTNTVRHDIISSLEQAYEELSIHDAQKLLLFENNKDFEIFVTQNTKWEPNHGKINFRKSEDAKPQFEYRHLIEETLNYTHELDRII